MSEAKHEIAFETESLDVRSVELSNVSECFYSAAVYTMVERLSEVRQQVQRAESQQNAFL